MAGTKWSALNALLGANLVGNEIVCIGDNPTATYTASTISIDETDNSINDSAAGLPVVPVGKLARVSGAVTATDANADHVVVSSTASKLVVQTDLAIAEAAGASITVEQIDASYKMTLDELGAFINTTSVPNPLTGHTFKDSRHSDVVANVTGTTTRNASAGNVHVLTLTGDCTIDVALGAANASYMHLVIKPGANTATLGTSFHKWIGSAPGAVAAEHSILVFSVDGGTTNVAIDIGGAA